MIEVDFCLFLAGLGLVVVALCVVALCVALGNHAMALNEREKALDEREAQCDSLRAENLHLKRLLSTGVLYKRVNRHRISK